MNSTKFIQAWNDAVGMDPGDFKDTFLGGLPATMSLGHRFFETEGHVHYNELKISGKLEDEQGNTIGSYDRTIDLKNNKASSDYFKIDEEYTGKGEGKTLLAANVALYQELGLDKVSTHANIDVGGYAWAKYGYVPTEDSWDELRNALREKLDSGGGGGGFTPDEWDAMSSDNQDRVRDQWKEDTRDEFLQSEEENWRDSGRALFDAKTKLAEDYSIKEQWANNAIDKVRAAHDGKLPFENDEILQAVSVEYDDSREEGKADPDFYFDEKNLPPKIKPEDVTDELWGEIEDALVDSFNGRAEDLEGEMDLPDYVADNIDDQQNDVWESMRDRDKFRYASDHGLVEEVEGDYSEESPSVEVYGKERDDLYAFLDDDDPKTIWAIADAPGGKELLLGSDWNGTIDFKDKDTMTRFNAYVGRKKESAAAAA
jgi:hypothetical protein